MTRERPPQESAWKGQPLLSHVAPEMGVPGTPDSLIPKRDTFPAPGCEEPHGSSAGLSLTHHMVHARRAPIAHVTVGDKGPESAHLGLHG